MVLCISMLFFLLGCPTEDDPTDSDTDSDAACVGVDEDQDGVDACTDCDDDDAGRFPGAVELCNGIDDNCDDALAWGEDDSDGDQLADCLTCDEQGFWYPELEGQDLRDALHEATKGLSCSDYSTVTTWMFTKLDKADGEVECVYTGRTTAVGSTKPSQGDMNTEHTWPQSYGASSSPMKCDVNHLYPTDSDANNRRGSFPFGEVTSSITWNEGGSMVGNDATGGTVFEPRDVHKGNVARSMLYFWVRYEDRLETSEISTQLDQDLYTQWDVDDPADEVEIERSLAIGDYLGSANPFVLCPGLVDRI